MNSRASAELHGRDVYDAAGNLTRGETARPSAYDARNRLSEIDGPLTTREFYDAQGERAKRTHGADSSLFFGLDHEIMKGKRFIKTIRVGSMTVASRRHASAGRVWGEPYGLRSSKIPRSVVRIGGSRTSDPRLSTPIRRAFARRRRPRRRIGELSRLRGPAFTSLAPGRPRRHTG